MRLQKINKRMCILDDNDRIVYSPPDFLRHKVKGGRGAYEMLLADILAAEKPIDAILAFETTHHAPAPPR